MKFVEDLCKKLNLNYLAYTNKTFCDGELGLPRLTCNLDCDIDYIALYSHPCDYCRTEHTAISFYDYDSKFNGKDGLYSAIYFDDKKLLGKYKTRFYESRFFIMPDITLIGNLQPVENHYRMFEQRVISLWLKFECEKIVIPTVGVACRDDFKYMLEGFDSVSVMALSTKGKIDDKNNRLLLIDTIKYLVDNNKNLKKLIVYDVCKDDVEARKICKYAIDMGIKVIIPDNILKQRNQKSISSVEPSK